MTKTLETLLHKADQTGEANKNGRMEYAYGQKGDLREQWHVTDKAGAFELRHWGTTILRTVGTRVGYVYGESNSDRDALNQALDWLGIEKHVHYYPSREALEVHDNETNAVEQII